MIQFKFATSDGTEIDVLKEKMHSALAGSPAYVNDEIIISDGDADNEFLLIVGNNCEDPNDNVEIGIVFDSQDVISEFVQDADEDDNDDNGEEIYEEDFFECEECKIPPSEE